MSELIKAFKNGKRGKFRRIDGGKLKFIRSDTGKVEKDLDPIHTTDTASCVCKSGDACTCDLKKNEATCDCTHEGVCKDDVDCDCDCTDRKTCSHRAESMVEKLDHLILSLETKLG